MIKESYDEKLFKAVSVNTIKLVTDNEVYVDDSLIKSDSNMEYCPR